MIARRPAAILHAIAGSPHLAECEDVPDACVICAVHWPRTVRYEKWQGANFTDQNRLRGHGLSNRVCEPCAWVHMWVPPPGWVHDPEAAARKLAAKEAAAKAAGKEPTGIDRPPNLRLFWHCWDARGYVFGTKGEKPRLREWLLSPKAGAWFCAIGDSGQKHVLPWTPLNADARGRRVRFEELDVEIGDASLVDTFSAALTAGVTKEEIESARYSPRSWSIAESHVRRLIALGRSLHGGGWWSLALWLAQRDEAAASARIEEQKAASAARRAARRKESEGGTRRRSKG